MEKDKDDSAVILIVQIIVFSVTCFLEWWFSPKKVKEE
jgi:hypothetical protein